MPKIPFSLIQVFDDPKDQIRGNISAVCFLENEMKASEMQRIANDFNQPATTFLGKKEYGENEFYVRWFAPDSEIGLCGHGSLAAGAFLKNEKATDAATLFYQKGKIKVGFAAGKIKILLEEIPIKQEILIPEELKKGLGIPIKNYFDTDNKNIVLAESESDVKNLRPDFAELRKMETFGYAVTAAGKDVDFVSRTLVPHVQQLEDHATGSSHAALVPFWAEKLSKKKLTALQLSPRGGKFWCELKGSQVQLTGGFTQLASGFLNASPM